MSVSNLLAGLQAQPLAVAISESAVAFPWIESVHVLAICFVFGSIAIVDLRLLGIASLGDRVVRMTREIVPWTVGAFVIAAITGTLMFISSAERYWDNGYFRAKLALLVLAGLNMLVFHFITGRDPRKIDEARRPPPAARVAGGVSLSLWLVIVVFGRWIGFTL
jgi:uncharacterized membrane protein